MDSPKPAWAMAIDAEEAETLSSLVRGGTGRPAWRDGEATWTPLGYAITHSTRAMVNVLLEAGVDPRETWREPAHAKIDEDLGLSGLISASYETWTPLLKAVDKKRADVVKALLEQNADVPGSEWPPLEKAILSSQAPARRRNSFWTDSCIEMVQLLLQYGVNTKEKLAERDYVAFAVAHKAPARIIQLLMAAGASGEAIKVLDLTNEGLEALPMWLLRCPNLKKVSWPLRDPADVLTTMNSSLF
jgi:hypothetical protein